MGSLGLELHTRHSCLSRPCAHHRAQYTNSLDPTKYTNFLKELIGAITVIDRQGQRTWRYCWPGKDQHLETSQQRLATLRADLSLASEHGAPVFERQRRATVVFQGWCVLQAKRRAHAALVAEESDEEVAAWEVPVSADWQAFLRELRQASPVEICDPTELAQRASLDGS